MDIVVQDHFDKIPTPAKPFTEDEKRNFVLKMFPNLGIGVASIERYIQSVRQGKRPEHHATPAPYSFEPLD